MRQYVFLLLTCCSFVIIYNGFVKLVFQTTPLEENSNYGSKIAVRHSHFADVRLFHNLLHEKELMFVFSDSKNNAGLKNMRIIKELKRKKK